MEKVKIDNPKYELVENEFSYDIDYFPKGIFSKETILHAHKDEDNLKYLTEQREQLSKIVRAINSFDELVNLLERMTSTAKALYVKSDIIKNDGIEKLLIAAEEALKKAKP